ncbi:MAG: hypothetical protein A3F84_07495 [Candidatus Handelsmanbacteria bacterium RIFCSPLOWO2_12_FULL_64_10]|uniref:Cytochrome c domain-containing protein n=1 Tax=Handelsmanbacteria sp. (strain RIFCSPLOWO2_12_FULL_64_10) TaxID=1817868 RepID=A0A1F6C7S9_HANXR|nr:MAG: hypothetical protein A3F84_07495 [Candidatus Handelsmanbacteria bacterium RIFCSPLOWO2_12_FULL_64_10]
MRAIWMRATALLALATLSAFGCARRQGGAEVASAQAGDTLRVELTYEQRKGQRVFTRYCAVCHGAEGAGDGFNAYNLNPKPRDLNDAQFQRAVSDEWLAEVIAQGGRGVSRSPLMPAWGHTLTKGRVREVVAFIRTLPGKPAPP